MNRKIIGALAVAAVVGLPLAVKLAGAKPSIEVELATLQNKEIQPAILASGNFVFRREVQLSSEVIGKVVEVLAQEGDRVVPGQVLLRLDPSSYRAEVAQQEANCRGAEVAIERAQLNVGTQQRNVERDRRLYAEHYINRSRFDETTHQLELAQVELRVSREGLQQARALLAQARERLGKTEVHAPIGGTVTAVTIKAGETAIASVTGIAGSSLMTIADLNSMTAEVNVDEADVARVTPGLAVRVFPAAFAEQPFPARVEQVALAPKSGAQGRSYGVKLRLLEAMPGIRTGMTCRVEILTSGGGPRPVLPLAAIQSSELPGAGGAAARQNYVFAVVDGVARKRMVTLGLADDANQEIAQGLAPGAAVVLGPARVLRDLREGDRVRAQAPQAKPLKLADGGGR